MKSVYFGDLPLAVLALVMRFETVAKFFLLVPLRLRLLFMSPPTKALSGCVAAAAQAPSRAGIATSASAASKNVDKGVGSWTFSGCRRAVVAMSVSWRALEPQQQTPVFGQKLRLRPADAPLRRLHDGTLEIGVTAVDDGTRHA